MPPPVAEIGASITDCASGAALEAVVNTVVVPRGCMAMRSDPTREITGPGKLRRQDIEVVAWMEPLGPVPQAVATSAIAPWAATMLTEFRASRRPAFDSLTPTAPAVPDSYSQETYWRRLRRHVCTAPLIMPAVAALVFNDRGEVLLVKTRARDRWMIPGGSVELGETVADAAVRKVREETGLTVEPYALLGAYTGQPFLTRYPNGDMTQHVSTPMLCRIGGGELRPDVDEIREVRAFGVEVLPPMFPSWERIARDAFSGRLGHLQ